MPATNWRRLFFSFDGRIGRAQFWKGTLVLVGLTLFLSTTLIVAAQAKIISDRAADLLSVGFVFLLTYPDAAVVAKRLKDRGRSIWLLLLVLGPAMLLVILQVLGVDPLERTALYASVLLLTVVSGIWSLIELGCLRGNSGVNRYGSNPLNGGTPAQA